jgi:hypothetical protein
MQSATNQFFESLRYSHVIASACELIFPGQTDADAVSVPVEDGTVTIDRTAQNRRVGTIQIPWSLDQSENLGIDIRTLPLGGYALVHRGLRYADGTTELVLLGRLRVESVTWDTLDASATLELADRGAQLADEPFTAPYAAAGMLPADVACGIVQDVFGSAIAYLQPYQPPTPMGDITFTGLRTDAISTLEQSYAAETYFNANGDFIFAAKPAGTDPVVWTVDASQTGVMVDASESLDRTGIYNGVIVTGTSAADGAPVTGLATYDDPTSAVRWGGPFGKVALMADSTTAATDADAAATAQSLLNLQLKQTQQLTLTTAPNPALEAGDTIQVDYPDGRTEQHLIDQVVTSLHTDPQNIITRTLLTPTITPHTNRRYHGRDVWREAADAKPIAA